MTGLANKVIISTRPVSNDDAIKNYLEEKGAVVLDLPLIEIAPSPITENIKYALQQISSYNWLIFTSRNGVECFFMALDLMGIHHDRLTSVKIAAFGDKTGREVIAHGFEPCFVSKANTSSDFLHELLEDHVSQGNKVLLSLGELAKTTLEDGLSQVADVTRIDVYRTIEAKSYPAEIIDRIKNNNYDLILFTSPSGFANFIKIMTENGCATGFRIACIGRTTEKEVVKHGYEPVLVSSKPEGTVFAMEIEKLLNN